MTRRVFLLIAAVLQVTQGLATHRRLVAHMQVDIHGSCVLKPDGLYVLSTFLNGLELINHNAPSFELEESNGRFTECHRSNAAGGGTWKFQVSLAGLTGNEAAQLFQLNKKQDNREWTQLLDITELPLTDITVSISEAVPSTTSKTSKVWDLKPVLGGFGPGAHQPAEFPSPATSKATIQRRRGGDYSSNSCGRSQTMCGPWCVDTHTSETNCGACGRSCDATQQCLDANCVSCGVGETSCGFQGCVNLNTDSANCGTCGRSCGAGSVCSLGQCQCPLASQTDCFGQCRDLSSDQFGCGSCTNYCGFASNLDLPYCSNSACSACPTTLSTCSFRTGFGRNVFQLKKCVDTNTDDENCGVCRNRCSDHSTCVNGKCVEAADEQSESTTSESSSASSSSSSPASSSSLPSSQSSGDEETCGISEILCDGQCVSPFSALHCGSCSNVCPTGATCSPDGQCNCESGHEVCGTSCVNTAINPTHCGRCGNPCTANTMCSNGQCQLECGGGQQNCGGSCVNTNNNEDFCGNCNTQCESNQQCINAQCTVQCTGGQTQCGTTCVNLQMNPDHCGACGISCQQGQTCTAGACATTGPAPTNVFNIELVFTGNTITTDHMAAFNAAARRWEQIIIGDLPDASSLGVDDVRIEATIQVIDGPGSVLGQAGPTRLRQGSNLPLEGVMEFDVDDVNALSTLGFQNVILHEMGHVLGVGTLWDIIGTATGLGDCQGAFFTGAAARAEYTKIFGNNIDQRGIPIETDGGPGTCDGHWDETIFGAELMTGFLNNGHNPLSAITAGSLQDMGYTVDINAADPYNPFNLNVVTGTGDEAILKSCHVTRPVPEVWNGN